MTEGMSTLELERCVSRERLIEIGNLNRRNQELINSIHKLENEAVELAKERDLYKSWWVESEFMLNEIRRLLK